MKKFVAVAVAVATIGLGSAAMAQSTMSSSMSVAPGSPTMVCRPAKTGETPNTMMGTVGLKCKKFDFAKAKAAFKQMMKADMAAGTPTDAQIEAAYQKAYGDMNLLGQHN